jgi:hypothetical protein
MAEYSIRLVLNDVEVEVLEEALDLYLSARPGSADHRFEYRYRAAHAIRGALSRPDPNGSRSPAGDDEFTPQGKSDPVAGIDD